MEATTTSCNVSSEYCVREAGADGWWTAVLLGGVVLVGSTIVLVAQGLFGTACLAIVVFGIAALAWGAREARRIESRRLVLTRDGCLEQREGSSTPLRVRLAAIRVLERRMVGEEFAPLLRVHYGHRQQFDWRADRDQLEELITRIAARHRHVVISGS
jgi:hypothetical protein